MSNEGLRRTDGTHEDEWYRCMYYAECGTLITVSSESVFASLMCDACRERVFKKRQITSEE